MAPSPTNDVFHRASYRWLLRHGHANSFYGGMDVAKHLHILACGVDLTRSAPIAEDRIPSFVDTFTEPAEHDAIVGAAVCNCGKDILIEAPAMPIGSLIAAVADYDAAEESPPGAIPDGDVYWFTVGERHNRVPFTRTEDRFTWPGNDASTIDWATLREHFGEPVEIITR